MAKEKPKEGVDLLAQAMQRVFNEEVEGKQEQALERQAPAAVQPPIIKLKTRIEP